MGILGFEFDTLKIKARLLLNKLKRVIKKVTNNLEEKNSNTHRKLQFLICLWFIVVKVVFWG